MNIIQSPSLGKRCHRTNKRNILFYVVFCKKKNRGIMIKIKNINSNDTTCKKKNRGIMIKIKNINSNDTTCKKLLKLRVTTLILLYT